MERYPPCPKCSKSDFVSKNGTRINRFSVKQRYYCRSDNTWFTPDDGFSRMRIDPRIILVALDLFYKNISLRGIKQHLLQFYNADVSHVTIRNWAKKYNQSKGDAGVKYKKVFSEINGPEMELFATVRKNIRRNRIREEVTI